MIAWGLQKLKALFYIKGNVLRYACLVLLALLAEGCITSAFIMAYNLRQGGYLEGWSDDDGRELLGIVYEPKKRLAYDLYMPRDLKKNVSAPLILFIHGGAWKEGRRQDIAYACKYYAKHGCITATMDYSLISEEKKDVTIYTMLDEITACIGAIKENVAAQGYKTPRIALGGLSAGGHLAMLYAYSRAKDSPMPIAFVCEKVGPSDFSTRAWKPKISTLLVSYGSGRHVKQEDLDKPDVQRLTATLSPVSHVTTNTVPTILAYGGNDNLVKRCHRDMLVEALVKNGVQHIEVDFPNSHHGMWNDPEQTEKFRAAVLEYCKRYMP